MEAITKDQLNLKLKEADEKYRLERSKILAEYARSNDIVEDGDLVTDHIGSIKVHDRKVSYGNGFPCMMYHGVRQKKDGTPFKSGEYTWIYQSNIEAINGVSTK